MPNLRKKFRNILKKVEDPSLEQRSASFGFCFSSVFAKSKVHEYFKRENVVCGSKTRPPREIYQVQSKSKLEVSSLSNHGAVTKARMSTLFSVKHPMVQLFKKKLS